MPTIASDSAARVAMLDQKYRLFEEALSRLAKQVIGERKNYEDLEMALKREEGETIKNVVTETSRPEEKSCIHESRGLTYEK
ncbi:hypothetical protein B7494_g131 [Chlorociboria aeruginascens]|nr:hypothetical protein B7494_g131 [Chlorociboria aeruginascens]